MNDLDYSRIMELAFAFWGTQTLFAAIDLDLFSVLSEGSMTPQELTGRLGLHQRGAANFLNALAALNLLVYANKKYANAPAAARYLSKHSAEYVGGLFQFASRRLYPVWGYLAEALRTGEPQNEARQEADYYANLCADRARHVNFLQGMAGLSLCAAQEIARLFPWQSFRSFADLGGSRGDVAALIAARNPHLAGVIFDLPALAEYADEFIEEQQLQGRLRFCAGDFFRDPFPSADVYIMGHVLHNWNTEQKRLLIQKAHSALPKHGALIVYEWFPEDHSANLLAVMMGLNMLLVTREGCSMTVSECEQYFSKAGFGEVTMQRLAGPCSMVIGQKALSARASSKRGKSRTTQPRRSNA